MFSFGKKTEAMQKERVWPTAKCKDQGKKGCLTFTSAKSEKSLWPMVSTAGPASWTTFWLCSKTGILRWPSGVTNCRNVRFFFARDCVAWCFCLCAWPRLLKKQMYIAPFASTWCLRTCEVQNWIHCMNPSHWLRFCNIQKKSVCAYLVAANPRDTHEYPPP